MNINLLIPTAYAQAASATTKAPADPTASGLEGLLGFIARNVDNWIAGVIILVLFYILAKSASRAARRAILKSKGEEVQESALILVERITTITVLIVGIAVAFAINGLNFTAVIGALSLGIGFALKDIIGNFISGVIMLSQNRIRIGDFVSVDGILGTITSIDVRATILQAIDGTEVVIPNQNMLNQTLISFSTNPFRRVELIVGVDYKTDLPMVTSLIRGIIEKDPDIVPKPEALVLVDAFGDSSINIKIFFWIESSNNWLKVRSNLANRIKKAFDEVGVSIPFPIRTLKLDEDDRTFLKTMDSLKKGIVPEPKGIPSDDQIRAAVEKTGSLPQVPYPLFSGASQATAAPTQNSADQTDTTPPPTHLQ